MPSQQMKGLTAFIVDIRNSKDVSEETKRIKLEINNIQTKLSGSHIKSYQRRKYVCKLVYIALMGYDESWTEFGIAESVKLLDSAVFSEKQTGYLALAVLKWQHLKTAEHTENLFDLTFPYLVIDLKANNEESNQLALQFIANNFNSGLKMPANHDLAMNWLELIDSIYALAVSPITNKTLKKKTIVPLLNLLKAYPDVLKTNNNWIPRILNLIDNDDLSIVLNSIPLVEFVIGQNPRFTSSLVPSIANNLNNLIALNKCDENFYYYKTPAPWLIVRLMQLLEACFLTDPDLQIDPKSAGLLRALMSKAIQNGSKSTHGLQNRNSQSSILFQAVSLATFLNAADDAINGAIAALFHLLTSNETNTRYLALEVLIKLIGRSYDKKLTFVTDLDTLFVLLNDRDISIKRKVLDLLYIVCNASNYIRIIDKLIEFYPFSEYSLKSELSIRIAILAERFADDSTWYVNLMIKLISLQTSSSSDTIHNEIWERITQIVVNNPELQATTCKLVLAKLTASTDTPSENLLKVAAFIIGEFGHKITNEISPEKQFQALYQSYLRVNLLTRAMILSTFARFLVHYPDEDFVPIIIDLFEVETNSLDLEIQTRAYEYLRLYTVRREYMEMIIKPIPPFETQQNHLLSRIGAVSKLVGATTGFVDASKIGAGKNKASNDDTVNDPFNDSKIILSTNWYNGYQRMLHFDAGIFYENQLVKITYRVSKVDNFKLVYKFVVINNSYKTEHTKLTSFKVLSLKSLASSVNPNYLVELTELPEQTVEAKTSVQFEVKVRNIVEADEAPILYMSFNFGGSFTQLNLKVPVNILKTLTPAPIALDEFKARYTQINQLLPDNQGEAVVRPTTTHRYSSSNLNRLLQRMGYHVVHCTPDDAQGILVMAAGILHTQNSNYGLLTTIKSVDDVGKKFEIVVKCTGGGVAEVVSATFKEIFEGKF